MSVLIAKLQLKFCFPSFLPSLLPSLLSFSHSFFLTVSHQTPQAIWHSGVLSPSGHYQAPVSSSVTRVEEMQLLSPVLPAVCCYFCSKISLESSSLKKKKKKTISRFNGLKRNQTSPQHPPCRKSEYETTSTGHGTEADSLGGVGRGTHLLGKVRWAMQVSSQLWRFARG